MPVTLTVSQVRDALYLSDDMPTPAKGNPTTRVLGRWFHEGISFLVSNDNETATSPLAVLSDIDEDLPTWREAIRQQAYLRFVGPKLTRNCAVLQEYPQQVLDFWAAFESASDWLAGLCWNLRAGQTGKRKRQLAPWNSLAEQFKFNQPLSWEFREPGWSDSVKLVGIADGLIQRVNNDDWCVVEFKSGQGSPGADLGQACLYHMILSELQRTAAASSDGDVAPTGNVALLSFQPRLQERLFATEELKTVRARLMDLIGRLAGVNVQPGESAAVAKPTDIQHIDRYAMLGQEIIKTLAEYKVTATIADPCKVGPTFLRFHVTLGPGMRVAAVEKCGPELQVRMKLQAQPFISLDQGQLVIDIQRPDRQTILFSKIRENLMPSSPAMGSSLVPVGVDLDGELVCADLSKPDHAHILVAGTTGSGKSEWLRTAIAGLMVANTPQTLRLVIIDPKRNAFHALRDSPYLWKPIVFPDEQPAYEVLRELCEEMDRRYSLLNGADTVTQAAASANLSIPRIVCVCDEFRDMVTRGPKVRQEIESAICRLGAKARAASIHLILATQEPSRRTITGPLDANMPVRVGLRMGKILESQMLLGESGAEKLLGNGDLLFKDVNAPRRLQAPFLNEAERQAIFATLG